LVFKTDIKQNHEIRGFALYPELDGDANYCVKGTISATQRFLLFSA